MAGEKRSGPDGEDPQKGTEDAWSGLVDRLEATPARGDEPVEEAEPRRDARQRTHDAAPTRPRSFLRPRVATALALLIVAIGLAWIALPALIGGDPSPRSESVSIRGRIRMRQARGAIRTHHRRLDRRGPKGQRVGPKRPRVPANPISPPAGASGSLEPAPAEPEVLSTPSQAPPSGSPAPFSTAPQIGPAEPYPSQPKGQAGLADGSKASAEFGL